MDNDRIRTAMQVHLPVSVKYEEDASAIMCHCKCDMSFPVSGYPAHLAIAIEPIIKAREQEAQEIQEEPVAMLFTPEQMLEKLYVLENKYNKLHIEHEKLKVEFDNELQAADPQRNEPDDKVDRQDLLEEVAIMVEEMSVTDVDDNLYETLQDFQGKIAQDIRRG